MTQATEAPDDTGRQPDPVDLDRERFLLDLTRQLGGVLEEVIGLEEASGMVSLVGGAIGGDLNDRYRRRYRTDKLDPRQVAEALVDLKRRIRGNFRVAELSADRIVLENTRCPFGDAVRGRRSMCMMTSNVFGKIAAENLGYARVRLERTIAQGDPGCRVVVHLAPTDTVGDVDGREYFSAGDG